jgi:hypothetical protein
MFASRWCANWVACGWNYLACVTCRQREGDLRSGTATDAGHQADPGDLEARHRLIAAGSTMQWLLGAPHNAVDCDAHKAYRVRIEAAGPFGLFEPLEYVISIDDLNGSPAAPPGNLHAVAAELHEMTKATKELNEIIRNASLEPA